MQLTGKTALITGAGRRIGRVLAHRLAERGANVVVHYHRSADEAQSLVSELQAQGVQAWALRADLADAAAVETLATEALANCGQIDVLINNASLFWRSPIQEADLAHWDIQQAVNVRAPWLLAKALGPAMVAAGAGKIINLTDYLAVRPVKDYTAYEVSKAALNGLTLALAKEFAPAVQVNAVSLGPILPAEDMTPDAEAKLIARLPLKRWGSPEDVAAAVLFLIEGSDFTTGSILSVDGGSLIR